jgi:hypothetical protein
MGFNIKQLKIGGSFYDVEYVDDLIDPDDKRKLDGRIIESNHTIKIEKFLDNQSQLQSLLHEAIHAICWQYNIDDTENFVVQICNGIFSLIVDNPEYIKKILKFAAKQKELQ